VVFNSIAFAVFFGLFMLGWWRLHRTQTAKWVYLTLASLVFYGWWDWRFVPLIIGSGLLDYWTGLLILERPRHKRLWLAISLAGNLGSLALFKYSFFLAQTADSILLHLTGQQCGLSGSIPAFALILPVGISFYTFQSMSYTIDVYMGRLRPVRNLWHFFAFLVMFPQLVAGPIIRARDILGQLASVRPLTADGTWSGIRLFVIGLFQKAVIADNLAPLVDDVYNGRIPVSGSLVWWAATIAFAFQIYCDFSGYSLMARGLARMMGYHFKMNFNHPYIATSMRGFWTRWHISLSTWFRDYVYIPLGGNAKGWAHGLLYMSMTMIISGFWHGANWTFLVWGGIHALALAIERSVGRHFSKAVPADPVRSFLSWLLVMVTVLIGWVFFRSADLGSALTALGHMFRIKWTTEGYQYFYNELIFLSLAILIEVFMAAASAHPFRSVRLTMRHPTWHAIALAMLATACIFLRGPVSEFIYFQF
jgi:D-alanyl-lipoteichoic acid acyltransferase DltB (MBOAT superfamily)